MDIYRWGISFQVSIMYSTFWGGISLGLMLNVCLRKSMHVHRGVRARFIPHLLIFLFFSFVSIGDLSRSILCNWQARASWLAFIHFSLDLPFFSFQGHFIYICNRRLDRTNTAIHISTSYLLYSSSLNTTRTSSPSSDWSAWGDWHFHETFLAQAKLEKSLYNT